MSAEPYLVFISHASSDRWIAKQMAAIIERKGKRRGVKTFLDEKDLEAGDRISDEIKRQIQTCAEFVVLLSPAAVERQWVLVEIGSAWGQDKRVTTIIDKLAPDKLPDIIRDLKAYDLNDFDQFVTELLRRRGRKKDR